MNIEAINEAIANSPENLEAYAKNRPFYVKTSEGRYTVFPKNMFKGYASGICVTDDITGLTEIFTAA